MYLGLAGLVCDRSVPAMSRQRFFNPIPFRRLIAAISKSSIRLMALVEYWRQLRPLYGEGSAPARWAKTLADWLTTPESAGGPGLVRGKNEPTVFYHPTRDLLVVVYVDDLLCDSFAQEISWFYESA
jgi:hypothetical protein